MEAAAVATRTRVAMWGGTTALGMDCSGYVQRVYRLNGIRLDRDADQQAMEGRAVDERGKLPAAGRTVGAIRRYLP